MIKISYFTDILCIWAYASQARIDAINEKFSDAIDVEYRFCSVFGDTEQKIASVWKDKGGYDGFNSHLREVAARFPHIELHPEIWVKTRPPTSASAHLFIKAVQHLTHEAKGQGNLLSKHTVAQVLSAFRAAFFRDGRNIACWDVQCEIAEALDIDRVAVERSIHDGTAFARLAADYQDVDRMRIEGSPSYVLNEGRQKLYGNVGFHLIEANIQELLNTRGENEASWC